MKKPKCEQCRKDMYLDTETGTPVWVCRLCGSVKSDKIWQKWLKQSKYAITEGV
jgi:ribosomal protein L37AE/L43A